MVCCCLTIVPVCFPRLRYRFPIRFPCKHSGEHDRDYSAFWSFSLGAKGSSRQLINLSAGAECPALTLIDGNDMKLTLESLKEHGAFTGRPVEKEITRKQGEKELTATVFVRPLGYYTARADILAIGGKVDGVAGRIAASICDETGKPVFTAADITGEADPERGALDGNLTVALLVAIQQVNNLGKTEPSAQTTKLVRTSP